MRPIPPPGSGDALVGSVESDPAEMRVEPEIPADPGASSYVHVDARGGVILLLPPALKHLFTTDPFAERKKPHELVLILIEIYERFWEISSRLANQVYEELAKADINPASQWPDPEARKKIFNNITGKLRLMVDHCISDSATIRSRLPVFNDNSTEAAELKQLVHDFNGHLQVLLGTLERINEALSNNSECYLDGLKNNLLLSGIIKRLVEAKTAHAIAFRLDIDSALEQSQFLYPSRARAFDRLIGNFVSNSIKYHRPSGEGGERHVEIVARLRGDQIVIGVKDNGMGMTRSFLRRYGQLHARSAEAVASGIPGSGVGVHSAFQRIRSLKGDVLSVKSELGKGTSVHFSIPSDLLDQTAVVVLDEGGGGSTQTDKPGDSPTRSPQARLTKNARGARFIAHRGGPMRGVGRLARTL